MTPEQANRSLAESLMGWEHNIDEDGKIFYSDNHDPPQLPFIIYGWDPYRRIDQALGDGGKGTVVGEMRGKGWKFKLIRYRDEIPHGWLASFGNNTFEAEADTPSAAITLAACRALGDE